MRAELECVVPQNSIVLQETVRKSPCNRQGHHTGGVQIFFLVFHEAQAVKYVIFF